MSRVIRLIGHEIHALVAIGIAYTLLAYRFWFICDDAYISFRYAQNWARGFGLRYNLGDHVPDEGYSNFLWVALCAVFEYVSANVIFWAPFVSFCCGLVLLALLYFVLIHRLRVDRAVAFLAVLGLACFPPFAVWASGGLETMPFSLALFITFYLMILRSGRPPEPDGVAPVAGGLSGLALSLLRPEGVAWALLIGLGSAASRRFKGLNPYRPIAIYFSIVVGGFAVYYAARYTYYQVPFANPTYIKVGFGLDVFLRGFRYVAVFFLTFLTPFLLLPGFVNCLRRRWIADGLPIALMALAFPVYAMVVGGDWMTMGRFLIPGLSFQAIVFALLLQSFWKPGRLRQLVLTGASAIVMTLSLLPAWNIHIVPHSVRARFRFMYSHPGFRSEHERWVQHSSMPLIWKEIGLALKDHARPGDSLVVGAIGAIGYYSDLFVYDRFGLVTRKVTTVPRQKHLRSPGHDGKVSRDFFVDEHPTFLLFDVIQSSSLRDRVIDQADEWKALGVGLWRRYVPEFMPLGDDPIEKDRRLLLVYRAIEDDPKDAVHELPRTERRRVRAERATKLWEEFYRKAEYLPNGVAF